MAAKRHSKEIRQAAAMLEALSDAKREIVLQLIRCLAEDEDADLYADEAAVKADLEWFARVGAGDYSDAVPLSEVEADLTRRRQGETAHV